MKKIISAAFTILFLSLGITAYAQEIFYSKESKFSFENSDISVLGWSGDRLYTYRASREGYFLDAYNDSMRLLATVALDFFPKKIYETKFVSYDNQIIILYQAVQNNYIVQYAAKLDDKARLLERPMVLDSVKAGWFNSDRKYYSYAVSNDKSKIMVFGLGNRKEKLITFNALLLDKDLNLLTSSQPGINRDLDINLGQSLLGNDGTLYLSAYSEENAKRFSSNAWIFSLSPDGQSFKNLPLPLETSYISGMFIKLDDAKNILYTAAFYSERKSGNLDGVFYGLFDARSNTFATTKLLPFDSKIRDAVDERNKKKAFNDFQVRNIIVKNDGGFVLVTESYYMSVRNHYANNYGYYSRYSYNPGMNRSTREFYYGDVLAIGYNAAGERSWYNFIRKQQYSQEDEGMFSSFAFLNSGATLAFLYNDFSATKSTLNLAALDGNGSLQFKKLNMGKVVVGDWITKMGKQTDATELVVPVLRKNTIVFARLNF